MRRAGGRSRSPGGGSRWARRIVCTRVLFEKSCTPRRNPASRSCTRDPPVLIWQHLGTAPEYLREAVWPWCPRGLHWSPVLSWWSPGGRRASRGASDGRGCVGRCGRLLVEVFVVSTLTN